MQKVVTSRSRSEPWVFGGCLFSLIQGDVYRRERVQIETVSHSMKYLLLPQRSQRDVRVQLGSYLRSVRCHAFLQFS